MSAGSSICSIAPATNSAPRGRSIRPTAQSCYEWVGTSYHFNADGYPGDSSLPPDMGNLYNPNSITGLAGVKISHVKNSSQTVMFFDACMPYQVRWHPKLMGNVCYVDGHVTFQTFPTPGQALW